MWTGQFVSTRSMAQQQTWKPDAAADESIGFVRDFVVDVAGGIDGGVAADSPDGVAAPLEFAERVVAGGIDGPADGNEYDAVRRQGKRLWHGRTYGTPYNRVARHGEG